MLKFPDERRTEGFSTQPTYTGGSSGVGGGIHEQRYVEPARYFVLVTKREKRACRSCEDLGVVSVPLPPRIIEKCLASERIVIETVVSKYCNHTPLHRQSMILERDLGLEISRATLDGWVLKVGELLIPMVAAMRRELISGSYIQADETPVDVQTREGRGKNHQAYLWQYSCPRGTVVFDFRLGRGRDGPKRFLGQFEGILQTDGYAAYDQIGGPRMVHAACWSHAGRQFFEAVQLNPRDSVATPIVAQVDELFAVDAEARRKTLTTAARHIRRQETARLCSMISAARSRQRSPLLCLPAHSESLPIRPRTVDAVELSRDAGADRLPLRFRVELG